MAGDKNIAIKGGFWTAVSTAVSIFSSFARIMILTRFLEKSDFGIVSIVNMVIGLCVTFTDLGFASVIIYKSKLSDKEFSSLFWIQLLLFLAIFMIICFVSPYISLFYEEPLLNNLIPIASITIFFQAFGKLYDSILQKKYRFRSLALRTILSNLISLLISVWLAIKGFGIYSLIISTLAQSLILNFWNFISGMKIQRLFFQCSPKLVLPLMKIGFFQTGTRILDFFSSKLDVMIIGKLLGSEVLGIYDLSKDLVYKLVDFIRTVVSKVALPIISNSNENDESVKSKFLLVTKAVAYLCIPICITIAVFSKDIVYILYGPKYVDLADLVSIFAIITMITSVISFFDMLGIAKGRTDLNFKNTIYRILLSTPVIFITCHWSSTAVALGQLFISIILAAVFWKVVVCNTYPISLRLYLRQMSHLLLLFMIIGGVFYCVNRFEAFAFIEVWIMRLIVSFSIYCIIIAVTSYLFLRKDIIFFVDLLNLNKQRNKRIS